MYFTLRLIKTKDGLLLEGSYPGEELEYYDLDGEGGKATKTPLTPWNEDYEYVEGIPSPEYDSEDENGDTFWNAWRTILEAAKKAGIELPDYCEA